MQKSAPYVVSNPNLVPINETSEMNQTNAIGMDIAKNDLLKSLYMLELKTSVRR